MNKYAAGVWHDWGITGDKGHEFPVPEGTLVSVLHRDGEVFHDIRVGQDEAEAWWIDSDNIQPGDIMAFRVEE